MQIYYKATYWAVIEVDNKEVFDKALDMLKKGLDIDDLYADDDIYKALLNNYVMRDSEQKMTPEENRGEPTIEVMDNNKTIWDNGR